MLTDELARAVADAYEEAVTVSEHLFRLGGRLDALVDRVGPVAREATRVGRLMGMQGVAARHRPPAEGPLDLCAARWLETVGHRFRTCINGLGTAAAALVTQDRCITELVTTLGDLRQARPGSFAVTIAAAQQFARAIETCALPGGDFEVPVPLEAPGSGSGTSVVASAGSAACPVAAAPACLAACTATCPAATGQAPPTVWARPDASVIASPSENRTAVKAPTEKV